MIKPVTLLVLGLNVRGRENLPVQGPAVLAANHNSHLDTMVLMSLYPLGVIHRVRPVAAADYFMRNRLLAWFSLKCIGIIPLDRSGTASRDRLFDACREVLDDGGILILFPEGSRGEPERMSPLKKGLFHLVSDRETTRVIPVVMHGLGRALPKGEAMLVPFNCDVVIGEPLPRAGSAEAFVDGLARTYEELFSYCLTRHDDEE